MRGRCFLLLVGLFGLFDLFGLCVCLLFGLFGWHDFVDCLLCLLGLFDCVLGCLTLWLVCVLGLNLAMFCLFGWFV